MAVSPSTKKAIASSLLFGLAGLVAILNSSTKTSFTHPLEGEERALSVIKETGFYTGDIAYLTIKPWGDALWSTDFSTKHLKKVNSLLFSSDGLENHKGSILCTDELCIGHGKATTALLIGADQGPVDGSFTNRFETIVELEILAPSFEICYTCPPGLNALFNPVSIDNSCTTNLAADGGLAADCLPLIETTAIAGVPGSMGSPGSRTTILRFHYPEEPVPSLFQLTLRLICRRVDETDP